MASNENGKVFTRENQMILYFSALLEKCSQKLSFLNLPVNVLKGKSVTLMRKFTE